MGHRHKEYLHAVTRVAYLENQLITREELFKLIDAESVEDAYRFLVNKQIFKDYNLEEYEMAFENNLAETYDLIEEITDNIGITKVFRYPIDGHNLKVMVKSKLASGDYSRLYKTGGSIEITNLKKAFDDKQFFYYIPSVLGEAALKAADKLAKTRDSQIVDILLDKAVIEMMGKEAAAFKSAYMKGYIIATIDMINIKSALRLLKMKKDTFVASKFFAAGGSFTLVEMEEAYSMGYDGIMDLIGKMSRSESLRESIKLIKQGEKIGIFQQQADKYFRELFETAREISFGIEPVLTYLYLKNQEIKACRFVLVSKIFGIPKEKIAEKAEEIYAG